MKSWILVLINLLLVLLLSGQALGNEGKSDLVIIAGTGDSQSLLRELSSQFEKFNSADNIIVQIPDSVGSSGGIHALRKNNATLARTARALKENEREAGFQEYQFARSPVVFAVHPSVKGVANLTQQQITGIYNRTYQSWDELGGPNKPIYPIHRELSDSSRRVIEHNIGDFPQETGIKMYYTTPAAALALSEHEFTIGYLPLSTAKAYNLQILSFKGVTPTEKNILQGNYKLVSPFYIVSIGLPSGPAKLFMQFLRSKPAKDMIRKYGAIPVL